jgi:ubiquinol-cytochrome c reductase cytochrome c1 subunit
MRIKNRLAVLACAALLAAGSASAEEGVALDSISPDVTDVASLQSGARTFVNYCMGCHGLSLMRYNQLLNLGLTEDQVKDHLMFTADKIGEPMASNMNKKEAKDWFGVAPPDLSVIARSRGADWLYTYLRSFYRDPERATGWNNTVFPNVGMPNVLWHLQGERALVEVPVVRDGKPVMEHGKPLMLAKFETIRPGTETSAQFDKTIYDLVNFLVWVGEPQQVKRKQIGYVVLIALGFLIFITWMLKREFWKDVH